MADEIAQKLESFEHIGFVVKDNDATIESWTSFFGLGPWKTFDPPGGPIKKMAFVKVGGTQFELLQPSDEKSLWSDFLETNGEGLHHLCTTTEDVDAEVARLVALGGEVMVSTPGAFAYVKTKEHGGLILELLKKRD